MIAAALSGAGSQTRHIRLGGEVRQQLPRARFAAPGGEEYPDRLVANAAEQVREQAQRRLVRPVGVVDDEHDRTRLGRANGEPVEAMENREAGISRRQRDGSACGCEQQRRGGCGTGEQVGPHVVGQTQQPPLEQRPGDAPPERLLHLAAGGAQHREIAPRHLAHLLDQR